MNEFDDRMEVEVRDDDKPVLDLLVTKHKYAPSKNLYNAFMVDADSDRKFKANIYMGAPHSEHEEETGVAHALRARDDGGSDDRRRQHVPVPRTVVSGRLADLRALAGDLISVPGHFVIF